MNRLKSRYHQFTDLFNWHNVLFRHKLAWIISITLGLVVILGSATAIIEENHPQANINSIPEGIWWAFVSITSVGYGDFYPVTWAGRFLAIILIVLGLTVISLLIANLASLMVEEEEQKELSLVHDHIHDLEEKIDRLIDGQQQVHPQITAPVKRGKKKRD